MGAGDGADHRAGFVAVFVSFRLRVGIQYHTAAGLHSGNAVFDIGRADHNAGIEGGIAAKLADCAAVAAATDFLGLCNQFHCTDFRCAGQGAHVHARLISMENIEVVA